MTLVVWPLRLGARRCRICGAAGCACGGPTTDLIPDDLPPLIREETQMAAELEKVKVRLPSGLETTFRVHPDKADRYRKMGQGAAEAETRARSPRQPATHAGSVETK